MCSVSPVRVATSWGPMNEVQPVLSGAACSRPQSAASNENEPVCFNWQAICVSVVEVWGVSLFLHGMGFCFLKLVIVMQCSLLGLSVQGFRVIFCQRGAKTCTEAVISEANASVQRSNRRKASARCGAWEVG